MPLCSCSSSQLVLGVLLFFGWMKSLNPDIDGVTGAETNRLVVDDPSSRPVAFSDRSLYVNPDPGHSMQAIYEQIYGVPFVDERATTITPPALHIRQAQVLMSHRTSTSKKFSGKAKPKKEPECPNRSSCDVKQEETEEQESDHDRYGPSDVHTFPISYSIKLV